jgi:hypothetical protein
MVPEPTPKGGWVGGEVMIDWYQYTMQAVPWYMMLCSWLVAGVCLTWVVESVWRGVRCRNQKR